MMHLIPEDCNGFAPVILATLSLVAVAGVIEALSTGVAP